MAVFHSWCESGPSLLVLFQQPYISLTVKPFGEIELYTGFAALDHQTVDLSTV